MSDIMHNSEWLYGGTAGGRLSGADHNGMGFSTKDNDNDVWSSFCDTTAAMIPTLTEYTTTVPRKITKVSGCIT